MSTERLTPVEVKDAFLDEQAAELIDRDIISSWHCPKTNQMVIVHTDTGYQAPIAEAALEGLLYPPNEAARARYTSPIYPLDCFEMRAAQNIAEFHASTTSSAHTVEDDDPLGDEPPCQKPDKGLSF